MNDYSNPNWTAPPEGCEIVFREVRTQEEMRRVLALRYEVYSQTEGLRQLPSLDAASCLDVDGFDLHSHHFGLFCRHTGHERVVGTLRITGDRPSPMAGAIGEIALTHPTLAPRLRAGRLAPLPMFFYFESLAPTRRLYDRLVDAGASVAEPGRLAIHPALRVATSRAGLRLSHFAIECALAFGLNVARFDHALLDCDVRLEGLYRRFGFESIPGETAAFQPGLGITMTALQATSESLPDAARTSVEALAEQLLARGEAVQPIAAGDRGGGPAKQRSASFGRRSDRIPAAMPRLESLPVAVPAAA